MKPIKTAQFSGEVLHLCFLKAVYHICCWGDYYFGRIFSVVGTVFERASLGHNRTFLEDVFVFYSPHFSHLIPHSKPMIYSFVQNKFIMCCSLLPFLSSARHLCFP